MAVRFVGAATRRAGSGPARRAWHGAPLRYWSAGGMAVKLLLVEDDKKIATAVKRGLEAEGFTVEVAFDGDDGLWLASEGAYDLIVLDILLPRRNGYRICADLRAAGNWTPILMLTAKDGDLDEAEAIDTGERRAWRGDDELALTAREFEVLEFLLRRAGQVLSKDEILAGVWQQDFDGDPNIIEVYVRRLRRKLDEPYGRRSIGTVRGAGYRLSDDAG